MGVAAAEASRSGVLVAGVAGLVAGAMSMAAGEYVSVSSQADTEKADLVRERQELETMPGPEREELRGIYVKRGLDPELAGKVADQLMQKDALGAHARDELGISEVQMARPVQAATASAATFAAGAALPLVTAAILPLSGIVPGVVAVSLASLALLGGLAAGAGGAPVAKGVLRVTFWGAFAMAVTAVIGRLFGAVV